MYDRTSHVTWFKVKSLKPKLYNKWNKVKLVCSYRCYVQQRVLYQRNLNMLVWMNRIRGCLYTVSVPLMEISVIHGGFRKTGGNVKIIICVRGNLCLLCSIVLTFVGHILVCSLFVEIWDILYVCERYIGFILCLWRFITMENIELLHVVGTLDILYICNPSWGGILIIFFVC